MKKVLLVVTFFIAHGLQAKEETEPGKIRRFMGSVYNVLRGGNSNGVIEFPAGKPAQIGMIKIQGPMEADAYCIDIVAQLDQIRRDPEIKGCLILIDSPGGVPGGCAIICREIAELAKTKPVVVLILGTCTSAAYHAICTASWIVAPSIAMIGSIGVYMILQKHKNPKITNSLAYSADLDIIVLPAGKFKAMDNSHTLLTDEARANFQDHVNRSYGCFCQDVATARGITADRSIWADGRIFTAQEALALPEGVKLIDEEGGFSAARRKLIALVKDQNANDTFDDNEIELVLVPKPSEQEQTRSGKQEPKRMKKPIKKKPHLQACFSSAEPEE